MGFKRDPSPSAACTPSPRVKDENPKNPRDKSNLFFIEIRRQADRQSLYCLHKHKVSYLLFIYLSYLRPNTGPPPQTDNNPSSTSSSSISCWTLRYLPWPSPCHRTASVQMLPGQRRSLFLEETIPVFGATLPSHLIFRKWRVQNSTPVRPNYSQTPFKSPTWPFGFSHYQLNINSTVWLHRHMTVPRRKEDAVLYSFFVDFHWCV